MIYREEHCDLFSVDKMFTLVHCVSGDLAMGAGIAKEFTKRGVKDAIKRRYNKPFRVGDILHTYETRWLGEVSMVTKDRFWHKPTYESMKKCLYALKTDVLAYGITKLAMPRIGCGLDKLDWSKVSSIIQYIFNDIDCEILVCIK